MFAYLQISTPWEHCHLLLLKHHALTCSWPCLRGKCVHVHLGTTYKRGGTKTILATPLSLTFLQPYHLFVSPYFDVSELVGNQNPSSTPFQLSISLTVSDTVFFSLLTRVMNTQGKLNWPIWSPTVWSPSYSTLDMNLETAGALIWERKNKKLFHTNQAWLWNQSLGSLDRDLLICVSFEGMVPPLGSSFLICFRSDWPAFMSSCEPTEKERETVIWRVAWETDSGRIKREERCRRATN